MLRKIGLLPLPADHARRIANARRCATWELGDSYWADLILSAYYAEDNWQPDKGDDG